MGNIIKKVVKKKEIKRKNFELELMNEILLKIIKDDYPFRTAINYVTKSYEIEPYKRNNIITTVGAELRHHYLCEYLMKKHFGEISVEEFSLLSLLFVNASFSRKIEKEDMLEFTNLQLKKLESLITPKQVEEFLEATNDSSHLIGEEVELNSLEYLKIRYNTPDWVIKMWKKHFGDNLALRILRANTSQPQSVVRVNVLSSSKEEILKDKENFEEIEGMENLLLYKGKEQLRHNRYSQLFDIFPTSKGMNYLLERVDVDSMKPIAIYQGSSGENLFLEVMMKVGRDVKMDLLLETEKDYQNVNRNIDKFGLKKSNVYLTNPSTILSCLSEPVSTFFVLPRSSNMQAMRTSPDYMLHFKRESLDEIINSEKLLLKEAYENTEEGGLIVYVVTTLSHKEGHSLIKEFVKNNPLSLIEEKQFLPFDKYDSSMYYAILRKEAPND